MPRSETNRMPHFNGRRKFYWNSPYALNVLIGRALLIPQPRHHILHTRRYPLPGHFYFIHEGKRYEIEVTCDGLMTGYYIICEEGAIRPLYKTLRIIVSEYNKTRSVRDINQPILPVTIHNKIETLIFDYFDAMKVLKTSKGFGNVGLIFAGPPGVGKTETMRWIGDEVARQYGKNYINLGVAQLRNILAEGEPLNTETHMIFIDDLDANILRDRRVTDNPYTSQFLACLDGINKQEGRVLIASTNENLEQVDPALLRPGRFDEVIHFTYPSLDLISEFFIKRDIQLDPTLFKNWSFARIDLFISRFKVEEYRYGTTLPAFYEKFIYDHGQEDPTVSEYLIN